MLARTKNNVYDVAVIGIGGVGSAALYQLAKRNRRVCGIEQFTLGHDKGSSHGDSRIIREAYFEHPNYVPLVRHAFEQWRQLSVECGQPLIETPGVLMFGSAQGAVVSGMKASSRLYGIAVDGLSPKECRQRYPDFALPSDISDPEILFEPGGGFIRVEAAVGCMAQLAVKHGAEIFQNERVQSWNDKDGLIELVTNQRRILSEKLIIATGPWMPEMGPLMQATSLSLQLFRMMMLWFAPRTAPAKNLPVFGYDLADGFYYGIPAVSAAGIKLGRHVPLEALDLAEHLGSELTPAQRDPILRFAASCLPFLSGQITRHAACIYTMTADQDFVIDQHPDDPRIVFAASCSGHGFKFVPTVGEILADLSLEGSTRLPIDFLRLGQRFPAAVG